MERVSKMNNLRTKLAFPLAIFFCTFQQKRSSMRFHWREPAFNEEIFGKMILSSHPSKSINKFSILRGVHVGQDWFNSRASG